jgi:hypothetical protein
MQDKSVAGRFTLARPSLRLLSLFSIYLRWFIGRHFRALHLAHSSRFPIGPGPLIVYLNHASWWDPLTCIMISRHFLPAAFHYAPMEAATLKHCGLLAGLASVASMNSGSDSARLSGRPYQGGYGSIRRS